ncbi:MAG: EAL domain-containing protein [Sulfuricella sp.]
MPLSLPQRTHAPQKSARKALGRAIEQTLHQWVDAINAIGSPIFIHDYEFRIVHANRAYAAAAGLPPGELIGKPYWEVFPKGKGPLPGCVRAYEEHDTEESRDEVVTTEGEIYLSNSFVIRDKSGKYLHSVHVMENITERRKLEERQKVAAQVFNSTAESIMILDARMSIIEVNQAYTATTGYAQQEVAGLKPWVVEAMLDRKFFKTIWKMLRVCDHWRCEAHKQRKNGDIFPALLNVSVVRDARGRAYRYILMFSDISELKASQEHFEFLANHDRLTGLPNRNLFYDRLQHGLDQALRSKEKLAVMFIDLDNFKTINDTMGHEMGDLVLTQTAERLRACTRKEDTIARLGGDEFTVLAEDLRDPIGVVSSTARRIIDMLAQPFHLDGHEAQVSASVGIALYPDNGPDLQNLLKNADAAMYQAKQTGKNNYQFFTEHMNVKAKQRAQMEKDLRLALKNDELFLAYQPQIELESGRIIGVEALLRWRHPQLGLIPPQQFIPVAESSGLILSLGDWVMSAACSQIAEWERRGMNGFRVAVNLSARQFRHNHLAESIRNIIAEKNTNPELLEIELTESAMMDDTDQASRTMHQLKDMGIHIAIDDFGMGYSSLNYLKRFPIDSLKIDGNFIREVASSEDDAAIASAIITMGHSMQLKVIAEGVETQEQMGFLKARECDAVQGFFMSHPMRAEKMTAILGVDPDYFAATNDD